MTFSQDQRIRLAIGILLTTIFCALLWSPPRPLAALENRLLDLRFQVRGAVPAADDVIIVAIDEASINRYGRWPWPRSVLAKLVDALTEAEASVIGFDVFLPEPESHDPELATALDRAGNVILPAVFDFGDQVAHHTESARLETSAIHEVTHAQHFLHYPPITAKGVLLPVPPLADAAMAIGQINMFPDRDGVLRWESLLIGYQDHLTPSLSLLAAAYQKGIPIERIRVDAGRSIQLGKTAIPTDAYGRLLINYRGGGGVFPIYSICDIISGTIPAEKLADRVVLVGATAVGIYDLRVTPLAAAMPGVEKHAAVIASLLDGQLLRQAPPATNLLLCAGSGLLLTLLLLRARAFSAAAAVALLLVCVALIGQLAFNRAGLWLNLTAPLLTLLTIYATITVYSFRSEERRARDIRQLFSSYVTARVVNELIRNPALARLGGARREVTVLFSDIRGFTTFSEKHSPTEVVALLNEYLAAMTEVIFRWEGTLDKFVGDEIMVFWGAPLPQTDHAERALRCALEMQSTLADLQQKWASEGKPQLEAGIGLNSGEVLVGNIGAEGKKMDYTVIGDNVNLGARVEGLTRHFAQSLLLTEYTVNQLRPILAAGQLLGVALDGVARVVVKGKEQPVALYTANSIDENLPARLVDVPADREVQVMTEK
jgi:adenylate cyclase